MPDTSEVKASLLPLSAHPTAQQRVQSNELRMRQQADESRSIFPVSLSIQAKATFTALLFLSFGAVIASAEQISFFVGSDPQYEFYANSIKTTRTDPTIAGAATLLSHCTECTKVFAILGDLSMDNDGQSEYASAHQSAEKLGIKILNGVGNHDLKLFPDTATTFNNINSLFRIFPGLFFIDDDDLRHNAEKPFRDTMGWEPFYAEQFKVDNDRSTCTTFSTAGSPEYCIDSGPGALYYTVALRNPNTPHGPAVAYAVQLHNAMESKTAAIYLQHLKAKLDSAGESAKPVILMGHQLGGSDKTEFKNVVKDMNVAAILYGHFHCTERPDKKEPNGHQLGHCDFKDNTAALLFDFASDKTIVNKNGTPIPSVNVNAIFHNIFWMFTLDSTAETVSFKRINAGGSGPIFGTIVGVLQSRSRLESLSRLIDAIDEADVTKQIFNFPTGKGFYTCGYHDSNKRSCTEQNP